MKDVHVVVAAIVARDGKFLFVEETIGAQTVLNQPAGHWEPGETLAQGMQREALEETGWEVEPEALLGLYQWEPPDLGYAFLRFAFVARAVRHHAQRTLDPGIVRAVWLTPDELRAERHRHRSPVVLRCVDDYLAGRRYPLELAHL